MIEVRNIKGYRNTNMLIFKESRILRLRYNIHKIDTQKDTNIQGYKETKIQRYKHKEMQPSESGNDIKIQRYNAIKIQRLCKDTKLPRNKDENTVR